MSRRMGRVSTRGGVHLTLEQEMFVRSRVGMFLDRRGVTFPLIHLLGEAYLQGMRDLLEAIEQRQGLIDRLAPAKAPANGTGTEHKEKVQTALDSSANSDE